MDGTGVTKRFQRLLVNYYGVTYRKQQAPPTAEGPYFPGADGRIRTADLLITNYLIVIIVDIIEPQIVLSIGPFKAHLPG
jgi:hypothetical protein